MNLAALAWRNMLRNKRRTIISAVAIFVAALSMLFYSTFVNSMIRDFSMNSFRYISGQLRIQHKDFAELERFNPISLNIANYKELLADLEELETVDIAVARIKNFGQVFKSLGTVVTNPSTITANIYGIDFTDEQDFAELQKYTVAGQIPTGPKEILISSKLAQNLGVKVADKITVIAINADLGQSIYTFKIAGIFVPPTVIITNSIFGSLADIGSLFALQDRALEINILLKAQSNLEYASAEVQNYLDSSKHENLVVDNWQDISSIFASLKISRMLMNIFQFIFFLLAGTVIMNTMMMTIFERKHEIATLSALGMYAREIHRIFLLEGLFISTIGTISGLIAGLLLVFGLNISSGGINLAGTTEQLQGLAISNTIPLFITPLSMLQIFLVSIITGTMVTLIPSRRAAKMKIIDALYA